MFTEEPDEISVYRVYTAVNSLEVGEKREILKMADVVFAKDVMTQKEVLIFGRKVLEEIKDGKGVHRQGFPISGRSPRFLTVELDLPTSELEYLVALVRRFKGYDDYEC